MAVVESYTLRLVTDLHGIGDAVVRQVDFSHETAGECADGAVYLHFMGVGSDIERCAVRHHAAAVGHTFDGGNRLTLGIDKLYDIGNIHRNSQPVVVNLQNVVGSVAQLPAVGVHEQLIADYAAILEIRETAVVGLICTFVKKHNLLLSSSRHETGGAENKSKNFSR